VRLRQRKQRTALCGTVGDAASVGEFGDAIQSWRQMAMVATCAIVVIRGTDVDTGDICGIIKQAFEDFTVIFQSTPPWLSSDAGVYVVDQTLAGLEMIQGLASGNQSLEAYLTSPANGNPVLVAAGHSLGGCLTTVTAVAELRLGPGWRQIADRSGGLRRAHGGKSSLRGLLHLHIPLLSGLLQRDEHSAGRLVESGRGYSLCNHCGVDLPDDVLVGLDSMIGLMDVFNMSYAQQ
jgi:hypothetical protein